MKTLGKKTIMLVACMVWLASCNDFLAEDPKGKLMTSDAFTQASDLEGAVNILYRRVGRSSFGITQFINSQMGDDLSTHPASNKAAIREWDNYTISTNNDRLLWCWEDKYQVIKAANYIINGAESTPDVTQEEIDYALGQAYFWRGWAYFYLVRAFGPLPKIVSLEIDFSAGLSSVSEIYELIVSDLKMAEKLPASYNTVPKSMNGVNVVASKGAAQAVLSYVYLTMAGWPLNRGAEYYQLAAAKALEVIDGSENGTYYYQLYDEYWKIHSKQENKQNKEAIAAIYYSKAFGNGDSSEAARGAINDLQDCSQGWTDTRAEIGFWVNFPDGPRKTATYPEVTYNSGNGNSYRWWSTDLPEPNRSPYFGKSAFTNDNNSAGSYEYDFTKGYESQGDGWSEQIHQLVRLAEVYLFYAEAVGRSGQTNARAISLLNKVRNRADGHGPVDDASINLYSAGLSATDLAEAAYNEHGWEIAGWYWGAIAPRYNDMQRMDRVKDHFNKRKANPEYVFKDPDTGQDVRVHEPFGPTGEWSQGKMFAPYPSEEIERNPVLNISIEDKLNLIN
ncbi:MAG: RagB/SusD family nutrient uptake outer membrane protein [Tannerella sp.]|jgi:hypothetical protein|nr:RagB/SusD family nutrient uptake outer membrane protein [Tannerella sp.]